MYFCSAYDSIHHIWKKFPISSVFLNSCNTSHCVRFLFSSLEFLFSNLELPQGTTKFIHHCHCDLQVKCYQPKYFTKVLWENKHLQGILKPSGKQIGNNYERCPCICGSLLSKALLISDWPLHFSSTESSYATKANQSHTTTSHPASIRDNTEPGVFNLH